MIKWWMQITNKNETAKNKRSLDWLSTVGTVSRKKVQLSLLMNFFNSLIRKIDK